MKKIICIGEALIDWICTDKNTDLSEGIHFIKKPGGAPFNVSICIGRLNGKSEFIGTVGNDPFGKLLKNILDKENVETDNVILLQNHATTFAFVSLFDNGERDFIFQRNADALLKWEDIKLIQEPQIWHFGSATGFLSGDLQSTYFKALEYAQTQNDFISFDPNFRTDLWRKNISDFIKHSQYFISKADFVKVSDEELLLISEKDNQGDAIHFFHQLGAKTVAVTLGSKGSLISSAGNQKIIPAKKVEAIDTTGAGDAFVGAMLWQLSQNDHINFEMWCNYTEKANQIAGLTTTAYGAIDALPYLKEI